MPDEDNEKLETDTFLISVGNEKSEMRKSVEKIQKDIKKRGGGALPVDFDEKAFMDEGWEC